MALIETLATDEDALSLLSEAMNFDFASKGIDEPFTDEELANVSGTQSMRDRVFAPAASPTRRRATSSGSVTAPARTERSWADRRKLPTDLEQWFTEPSPTAPCWRRDPRPRHVHGFREIRRAGTAAARAVSQGLRRRHIAREPWHPRSARYMERRTMNSALPSAIRARISTSRWSSCSGGRARLRLCLDSGSLRHRRDDTARLSRGLTKRIKLGTGIIQLAARTPANAAMCAGDGRCDGGRRRFIAGLGVSGPQIVEGWYGEPWGRPYYRYKDYVAIMRKIFRREAPVTHDGPRDHPALHRRRRARASASR